MKKLKMNEKIEKKQTKVELLDDSYVPFNDNKKMQTMYATIAKLFYWK